MLDLSSKEISKSSRNVLKIAEAWFYLRLEHSRLSIQGCGSGRGRVGDFRHEFIVEGIKIFDTNSLWKESRYLK